ncbi:MAG: hypothetical protein WBD46_04745 [Acidobacteriaceae bacterium]
MAEGPWSGNAVQKTENAALEMYRFAALMLGNETEAQRLVENSVAAVEIDPCADPCAAKGQVRERVIDGALEIMHRQDPASFAALPPVDVNTACLEEEAPVSGEDLSHLLTGAGRGTLREWLGRLTQAQRAVFVQRAVLGWTNADTARAINRIARPLVWTPEAVGSLFRQALCSLASALVHAAAGAHA